MTAKPSARGLNIEGKLKKMIILPDFGEDEDE